MEAGETHAETIHRFSQNRKLRRQYQKQTGTYLPPINFPYVKLIVKE